MSVQARRHCEYAMALLDGRKRSGPAECGEMVDDTGGTGMADWEFSILSRSLIAVKADLKYC